MPYTNFNCFKWLNCARIYTTKHDVCTPFDATKIYLKFKFLIWGKEKWLKNLKSVYIVRNFDHKNKKNNCFLWLILGFKKNNLVEPITSRNGDNQLGMILET